MLHHHPQVLVPARAEVLDEAAECFAAADKALGAATARAASGCQGGQGHRRAKACVKKQALATRLPH